jgi:L-rhamnose mutarotase
MRLAFALDLHDDPELIAAYDAWHREDKIWPSIVDSLLASGLTDLEIFRTGNRLFLTIEAPEHFSLDEKARADAADAAVQAWERLMWSFQKVLPWAAPDQKWVPMVRIFSLAAIAKRSA